MYLNSCTTTPRTALSLETASSRIARASSWGFKVLADFLRLLMRPLRSFMAALKFASAPSLAVRISVKSNLTEAAVMAWLGFSWLSRYSAIFTIFVCKFSGLIFYLVKLPRYWIVSILDLIISLKLGVEKPLSSITPNSFEKAQCMKHACTLCSNGFELSQWIIW